MKTTNHIFLVLVLFVVAACTDTSKRSEVEGDNRADRGAQVAQDKNITDVTVGKPSVSHIAENYDMLSTFAGLCQRGNLDSLLQEGDHYTIFAPSDEAYRNFRNQNNKADSLYNLNLAQNLSHLVVKDTYSATDLLKQKSLKTLDGTNLSINDKNGEITIDQAKIIYPDMQANNATIQVIDKVLVPGTE